MPSHPKVVELVNAWGWEEYGSQIRIGKPPVISRVVHPAYF